VLLFSSVALPIELAGVLVRPVPAKRLALICREAHEVLVDYIDAIELVTPSSVPRVVAVDADDDQVIAAAAASQADLVITGDRDLLVLGSHGRTRIVGPADAVRLIGNAGP
jgi:putative PIN family toxin of toxin-antitoxin system